MPAVDRLREVRSGERDGDPIAALDEVRAAVEGLSGLLSDRQISATLADLAVWAGTGCEGVPNFDATRDAVPAPEDGEAAAYIGPVILPNSDRHEVHIEAFSVVRQDPDCTPYLQDVYPHPKAVFQSTRLLSASRGLREGNCVVFFPENIPAATRCTHQNFAWFFFNRHVDIYAQTLAITERLCGPGSPFAADTGLVSPGIDPEDVYQARCVWGYLHDYFHHTGPRPLDQHLPLKTKWRPGLLEELKVDMKTAIACFEEDVPFGPVVFEYVLLERLFRYPAQPEPLRNFDSGTGFALGTWLAAHGLFTEDGQGRRALGAKAEIVECVRELVRRIEKIETIEDDDAYRTGAVDFLYGTLLRRPESKPDRYGGPLAPIGLWGSEVHV
ncbi:DUF6421 family protein [Streptomyces sp. NBC_00250]|uniref:DUF6421 family protein n=1 Tax=Streptomyces sp. NBC_00250 TaxID=2903641 RepID=UPI002E28ED30|nr:DUF6421 family protein [Streptomyces sp. NBC_00250]